MIFKFHCACGQRVSATEDMVGTSAICPRCGSSVVVPAPPETADAAPAAAPTRPPPPSSPPPPPPPPAVTTLPVAPLSVVRRPLGLLWLTAAVVVTVLLGLVAFLFRDHLATLPKQAMTPVFAWVTWGPAVASVVIAMLLRWAVRIVCRFDLAFLEAWLVTVFTTALDLLAIVPFAMVQLRIARPEDAAKFLAIALGLNLLLTIVAYAFLIRNALGRPIGIGRGILTYLLRSAFLGVLAGIGFGIIVAIRLRS